MGLVDVALGVRPQLFGLAVAPVLLVTPLEPGCQILPKFGGLAINFHLVDLVQKRVQNL